MTEILYGRHPILEVLRAGRRSIDTLEIALGVKRSEVITDILDLASQSEIEVVERPKSEIDRVSDHHQGILAYASDYPYVSFDRILDVSGDKDRPAIVLLLDIIQDPQNLGTLLRSAEAVGVDGVVLPTRRGVGVTPAVVRASAGASEHLWIAHYNLAQAMRMLKEKDFWVFGLENSEDAIGIENADLTTPLAVVIGGEGEGMRRLSREGCDQLLRLPMRGRVGSLNAAVAGSVALYFIWHSRGFRTS